MKKTAIVTVLLLLASALSACSASAAKNNSASAQETTEYAEGYAEEYTTEYTEEYAEKAASENGAEARKDAADNSVSEENEQDIFPLLDSQAEAQSGESSADTSDPDVDLTALSSTMVYAEVYNMMYTPDDYLGKTVRMTGTFAVYTGEERNYYTCIVADATACCSQGIEFVLEGAFSYPEDYPEVGSTITVSGIFDTYYEGDYRYAQLIDATLG